MADRVFDDDRPTVDLGPRPSDEEPPEAVDVGELTAEGPPPAESVHAQPTQQLPPRKRPSSTSMSRGALSDSRTTISPVEAMRLDEVERTRVFARIALALCAGGILVALLSSGDLIAQRVVVAGSAIAAAGALWILRAIRDQDYQQHKVVVPALMVAFGAMSGVYYWGTASPITAMVVYGIYFFSLGANKRVTLGMWLVVSLIHGAFGAAIITGVIVDRGVISMQGLKTLDQISVIAIVEFLYFAAYLTARMSQKVTFDAMHKLEQAVRGVAQREALLAEARAELDRALKVGGPGRFTEQVVGSFRLGILIGRGGMGEVYEAHGVKDKREAAVKLLHPGTLADPTSVARFMREAQTASKLDCPYVVRVLEVGTTAGEIPFLAMERLRGHDLAHQLRRQRRLQLAVANAVAGQVAVGLEAARAAGIVHRDLKPHNLFSSEEGGARRWKILDFGVSKSGGSGTLTQGHVIGTPAYMAPEQARGEDVDHRADVYSLAAILFRAVTGHPAFTGKDVPTTLYDVVYRVPTQPTLLAELPADVDRVLALGLAKDPKDRFATALELAEWFALAIESSLTPAQRQRADEVIARQPWGTRS
ncbi:MAG TPA: serine/threonine-protein kinase [Kofleriaceae bacterium]|nr:serine/threonine-protein kinase [Kofleriaceae bacterium]